MWDPPRPGLEPVSPALAGGFLTTAPPGKPPVRSFFITDFISHLVIGLFKLSVSTIFSFGGLYVSRKLYISSRLSNLLAYDNS